MFSGARRDAGEESEEIRFKVVAVAVFVAMGESKRTRETMLDIWSYIVLFLFDELIDENTKKNAIKYNSYSSCRRRRHFFSLLLFSL